MNKRSSFRIVTKFSSAFSLFALFVLSSACTTTSQLSGAEKTSGERLYWKVYPKSDNTFYLLPRPEFTSEFPDPHAINSLKETQAQVMASKLNSQLQFNVSKADEGGTLVVRIVPEPLIEDIVDICAQGAPHALLEKRCKKELAWHQKGSRPDIYLAFDACEAVVMANKLNDLYKKPHSKSTLCPALNQVEK